MTSPAMARIDASMQRLDHVIDQRLRREEQALAADNAERRRADAAMAEEAREQVRRDADRSVRHQTRYDSVFEKHGRRAPQPAADASPPDYRRELFAIAQSMLPSDHWLAKVDPSEIDGTAIGPMEKLLLAACAAEAETPSFDNLPDSVDSPRAKLERTDSATGERSIVWRAKRSFISDLSRPAQTVMRIVDPKKGIVLQGPDFPRAR